MKVTVFGDSILKGVRMEDGRYLVAKDWQRMLEEEFGLEIENRSRFGWTVQKAFPFIRRDCGEAVPEGAPGENRVLLEFGGNDCDFHWEEIASDPERGYSCKTPPSVFRRLYTEAIRTVQESGRTPVALTLPPILSGRYLRFFCRGGLSEENVLRWLGDEEAISRWQERFSDTVAEVAREEGAELIDLRRAFPKQTEALKKYLCEDGIHPSGLGQELIFSELRRAALALC